MIRRTGALFPYTRAAVLSTQEKQRLGESVLGALAASEYGLIQLMLIYSRVTDEDKKLG